MEGTLPWDKGFGTELAMGKGCWAYNLTADIKPGFNVSHSPQVSLGEPGIPLLRIYSASDLSAGNMQGP